MDRQPPRRGLLANIWVKESRKGYVRGASLFSAEPAADARAAAIKVRAAVPVEHEFSIRNVDAGFVVDVFPRFTEAGPGGFDMRQTHKILDDLDDNVEAFPTDYRSI